MSPTEPDTADPPYPAVTPPPKPESGVWSAFERPMTDLDEGPLPDWLSDLAADPPAAADPPEFPSDDMIRLPDADLLQALADDPAFAPAGPAPRPESDAAILIEPDPPADVAAEIFVPDAAADEPPAGPEFEFELPNWDAAAADDGPAFDAVEVEELTGRAGDVSPPSLGATGELPDAAEARGAEAPRPPEPPPAADEVPDSALTPANRILDDLLAVEDDLFGGPDLDFAAGPAAAPAKVEADRPYIVFALGGQDHAVPIAGVVEVGPRPAVTPLPFAPAWLLGLTNLRGDIISVIDLRTLFDLPHAGPARGERLLVVRGTATDAVAGFVVDAVRGLRRQAGAVRDVPRNSDSAFGPCLAGALDLDGRLVAVLDPDRLLARSQPQTADTL